MVKILSPPGQGGNGCNLKWIEAYSRTVPASLRAAGLTAADGDQ